MIYAVDIGPEKLIGAAMPEWFPRGAIWKSLTKMEDPRTNRQAAEDFVETLRYGDMVLVLGDRAREALCLPRGILFHPIQRFGCQFRCLPALRDEIYRNDCFIAVLNLLKEELSAKQN